MQETSPLNYKPLKSILLSLLLVSCIFAPYSSSASSKKEKAQSKEKKLKEIRAKSEDLKKKIEETKQKERAAAGRLTQIQRNLHNTQDKLRRNKFKLASTHKNLKVTEEKLAELKKDHLRLTINSEGRIRQIYQGQRLRMLEFLIKSPSITDFLDTLYYQKLIIARDKILLEKLNEQSEEIEKYKDRLAQQKIKMANIVTSIDGQKRKIASEHSRQQVLVSKLRTERSSYEKAERELEQDSQKLISEINTLIGKSKFVGIGLRGTGLFSYPVVARISSPFGPRRHPIHRVSSFHSGIDLAAPNRTPIMASDSGRVIFNGWYGGYGKVVILDHGKSYTTLYAHLSRATARKGKNVKKGDIIGYEGTTGYSTGPHLHFEIRKNGKPQNPVKYLR